MLRILKFLNELKVFVTINFFFLNFLHFPLLYKGRFTVVLNCEDYLEKCMDHINSGSYQLLKKDLTPKLKIRYGSS